MINAKESLRKDLKDSAKRNFNVYLVWNGLRPRHCMYVISKTLSVKDNKQKII